MDLLFKNKKITGILSIVPQKVVSFEEEMANYNFSPAKSKKLALVMGYKQHRIALDHQTSADFCMDCNIYLIIIFLIKIVLMLCCLYLKAPTISCLQRQMSFKVILI